MHYSHYDPPMLDRAPWNAGKQVGTKHQLSQKQIRAVRISVDREGRIRDRAGETGPNVESLTEGCLRPIVH